MTKSNAQKMYKTIYQMAIQMADHNAECLEDVTREEAYWVGIKETREWVQALTDRAIHDAIVELHK